jgi:hypothetical protein
MESNIQSMIDLSADTMPHQLKGIEKGRQDVRWLLFDTWKIFQEQNDEVNDSIQLKGTCEYYVFFSFNF